MQFTYEADHLIEQIKKRPGIWHYEHPDYKAAAKRNQLWMEVVHELLSPDANVTKAEIHELVFLLQKKFKGMKDSYHRYILGFRKFSRPYMYSEQLQFLLKNYDSAKIDPQLREAARQEPTTKQTWAKKRTYKLELSGAEAGDETNDKANDEAIYECEIPVITSIKSIPKSSDEDNDQQSDVPKSDSDDDCPVSPKKAKTTSAPERFAFANVDSLNLEEDPEKMFLLSMLPHLKALPERSRLQVKLKLMQVLLSATENE